MNIAPARAWTPARTMTRALLLIAAFMCMSTGTAAAGTWGLLSSHVNSAGGQELVRKSGGNTYTVTVRNESLGVGATLTCDPSVFWTNGPSFSYQWLRAGQVIAGETASTYTTVPADAGKTVQCQTRASNAGGGTAAVTPATAVNPIPTSALPAPPVGWTAAPGGTASPGNTLTCPAAAWTGSPTMSYQWLRNGEAIAGATSNSYVVQAGDVPSNLQCKGTGTNSAGSLSAVSGLKNTTTAPSPAVPAGGNTLTALIFPAGAFLGGQVPGNTLTCSNAGSTGATISYQWLRNGVAIGGATSSTYTLTASDASAGIQCRVTSANANAGSAQVSTPPIVVGPVPAATVIRNAVPIVSGPGTEGNDLSCTQGTWMGNPTSFSFQWLKNGVPIADATNSIYKVQSGDVPSAIQCQVTATKPGGPAAASLSLNKLTAPTAPNPAAPVATAAASGPDSVTLTESLPEGLDIYSMSGTGWNCSVAARKCTRSDVLAPGNGYPNISVGIHVGPNAADDASPTATISGAGGPDASLTDETVIVPAIPFDIASFSTSVIDEFLDDLTQAGGHPYRASAEFSFPTTMNDAGKTVVVEDPRKISTELPPGFYGNPQVAEECPIHLVASTPVSPSKCPDGSAVGTVVLTTSEGDFGTGVNTAVYNVTPEHGYPAEFAFSAFAKTFFVYPKLRSDGDYGITVESPLTQQNGIKSVTFGFCGFGVTAPKSTSPSCTLPTAPGASEKPLLTNPTVCSDEGPVTKMTLDSWQNPGNWKVASFTSPEVTGCDQLTFEPTIDVAPTSNTAVDAPAAYDVELKVPQPNDPNDPDTVYDRNELATPPLEDAHVTLPAGVAVSPSAANGLEGCSDLASDPAGDQVKIGTLGEATCPEASKIGTVEVHTPLLADADDGGPSLTGEVFVLKPHPGDFSPSGKEDGKFRLLIQIVSKRYGIVVKLPGTARADAVTGQLSATFEQNPQLPFSKLVVHFKGGDRAALVNPATCGNKVTDADLTSWGGPSAEISSGFDVSWDGAGAACPAELPFGPTVSAGTATAAAGGSSPFVLNVNRPDRQDVMDGITVELPPGLLASVRGVPLCKGADAASGACPAGSRIGTATVASGPGDTPFWLDGPAYLTEGYKGAPYGMAVVVRAVAGPFDLGTVVVRQALHVDRSNAHVTAISDPFPTILDGVPVRLRTIRVNVDRQGFMRSPTSCAAKEIKTAVHSATGKTSNSSTAYRVGGCAALPFKPKLGLRLTGRKQVMTGKHPGIRAQVNQDAGEAGIGRAAVRLPKSLALDPTNAQALCEYEDGTKDDLESRCPKGSIVGRARAVSPLLNEPLVGDVYFVKNVRRDPKTGNVIRTLPMIVAALRGEIAINLVGKSDVRNGKLVSIFDTVPDAPVSQFNLNIAGGKNGIIAVTRTRRGLINLCATPSGHVAESIMDGHNGWRDDTNIRMATPCSKRQVKRAKRAAKKAAKAQR